ncbi:MAG: glycosyl hydrolase [Bacteroidota bacterium]
MKKNYCLFLISLLCISCSLSYGQSRKKKKNKEESSVFTFSGEQLQAMKWRNIGPFRGGRSTAVSGVIQDTQTFYFGSTGGGVWKTINGGAIWRNVSDGYFGTGSVGAIAVSASDPNVVVVGTGEAPIRGVMTSHGDGVYLSTDAGASWRNIGLQKVRQISRVRIHPQNPDIIYVGAQGSPYAPTEDRGVYKTVDGGKNWEKILFVDKRSGVSDLSMDVTNPRILYAAFWDHQRHPWKMESGGEGSSIWKTTDGGENWQKLKKGLPSAIMGKIGVAVSPANPQKVYAIIESDEGGLYRSDNGGKEWKLINSNRVLRARSWYYMHMFADPVNPDKIVVLNAPFMQSMDGGKTFKQLPTPHGDNHDLWIHPDNPDIMINANDGGANISYNGGKTWSTQSNQPTAQFYRINVDNQFPYQVYGGQQDNSTVAIPNRTFDSGIKNEDMHSVGGCESAYCAFDPDDPRYVYAGCYQGIITEYDQELIYEKDVMAYPFLGLGEDPADMKYRFNWNAPILVSQHDSRIIYHAGNKLLKSTDRGVSWEEISPDLTRNLSEHIVRGGGPITNEGAGGENYHTLMYIAESPDEADIIWAGADDGLLHLTRDGGESWANITPAGDQEGMINNIELVKGKPGKAYVAFNRYKFNDFTPHVWVTEDYGSTWEDRTKGFEAEAHVRVVRHDPEQEGLLYAGTETGLYLSYDDGLNWQPFQRNLPVVPITDMKVHQGDLVVATQGRAFWILDDLSPVRMMSEENSQKNLMVYPSRDAYLVDGVRRDSMPDRGTNPDNGVVIHYSLGDPADSLTLSVDIMDGANESIYAFSSTEKSKAKQAPAEKGLNKLVWNLAYESYKAPKGIMTLGGNSGPKVGPGTYQIKVKYGSDSSLQSVQVLPNPKWKMGEEAFAEQSRVMKELREATVELYQEVNDLNYIKNQIKGFTDRKDWEDSTLSDMAKRAQQNLDSLINTMVQPKQKTFQDVINFPNQLDAKLIHMQRTLNGIMPPLTSGQKILSAELLTEWREKETAIQKYLDTDIEELNEKIKEIDLPFFATEKEESTY